MKHMNIYDDKCYAYIMDHSRSCDINDKTDMKIVEALLTDD